MVAKEQGIAEAEGADDENMGGAARGYHPLIAALRVKSPSPKKSPGEWAGRFEPEIQMPGRGRE